MPTIIITTDAEHLRAILGEKAQELSQRLKSTINDASVKLQAHILGRPDTPVSAEHRHKGWLAGSVRPIPATEFDGVVSGGVVAGGGSAWYAKLFEYGTSDAYQITVVNAKALLVKMVGQTLYLHSVMHPPFDASKLAFMHPAFAEMSDKMTQMVATTVNEVLHGR